MRIRKATIGDQDSIYSLVCNLAGEELDYGQVCSILEEHWADNSHVYLVAEEAGSIRGFVHLRFERQLHHASLVGEIIEFDVDPNCRSQGIGKLLFREAQNAARLRSCPQLEVTTNQRRARAHTFYERLGMINSHYKFTQVLE